MAVKGRYVLDKNVLPASDSIEFPEQPVFIMPAHHRPVLNRNNDDDVDVGIMYLPLRRRDHAK